ncbi:MAG TPA: dihydroorotate dehydrogenase-like protein [Bacteroidetes bacterium]|nr:dihydroorotate dehydrogenase-like protein [Bacteroidota bacterium]
MDLTTTYLGLKLKNPIVPSASPLSATVDQVRRLEDAGAAAVVLYSLFEEQINHQVETVDHFLTTYNESYAEALSYFPEPGTFNNLYAEEYLDHIRNLKKSVDIPIIASLNGVSEGGWMEYAKKMEEAGADALELNIYYLAVDPAVSGREVERMYIEDVKRVKQNLNIPVAVKLGPYFSSFANMAVELDNAGADGLVLFNRFYQPDIDLEMMEVSPSLVLSSNYEKRLPMRWIAILNGQIKASLAATSGVHTAEDAIKMILCGADVAMVASVLLRKGIEHLGELITDLESWMIEHNYTSITQMKGSMSHQNVAEPAAFERANYLKILQSFRK